MTTPWSTIFSNIAALVKTSNSAETLAGTTLPADEDSIEDEFEGDDMTHFLSLGGKTLAQSYSTMQSAV